MKYCCYRCGRPKIYILSMHKKEVETLKLDVTTMFFLVFIPIRHILAFLTAVIGCHSRSTSNCIRCRALEYLTMVLRWETVTRRRRNAVKSRLLWRQSNSFTDPWLTLKQFGGGGHLSSRVLIHFTSPQKHCEWW